MVLICGRANQICQKRRICSAAIKYDALRMLRGSECYVLSGEKLMRRLDRCPNPYASPDDVAILFHGRMIIEQSPQRLRPYSVDQDYRPIVRHFQADTSSAVAEDHGGTPLDAAVTCRRPGDGTDGIRG